MFLSENMHAPMDYSWNKVVQNKYFSFSFHTIFKPTSNILVFNYLCSVLTCLNINLKLEFSCIFKKINLHLNNHAVKFLVVLKSFNFLSLDKDFISNMVYNIVLSVFNGFYYL